MMVYLIVEQSFDPPLSDEEHSRFAERLDPCLESHGAKWMRSYLSTDRRRMVCEFEAADAEAVRQSYRSAGLKFDRVWAAERYTREVGV
jgi:hypothetical protein